MPAASRDRDCRARCMLPHHRRHRRSDARHGLAQFSATARRTWRWQGGIAAAAAHESGPSAPAARRRSRGRQVEGGHLVLGPEDLVGADRPKTATSSGACFVGVAEERGDLCAHGLGMISPPAAHRQLLGELLATSPPIRRPTATVSSSHGDSPLRVHCSGGVQPADSFVSTAPSTILDGPTADEPSGPAPP